MSFIWTRKIGKVRPIQVVMSSEVLSVLDIQEVRVPSYRLESDKISCIEHKNGECLASSCKEDDAFGGGEEEVDGQEVVLSRTEDGKVVLQEGTCDGEEDSSSLASLKK
jgi:hypothetical protein